MPGPLKPLFGGADSYIVLAGTLVINAPATGSAYAIGGWATHNMNWLVGGTTNNGGVMTQVTSSYGLPGVERLSSGTYQLNIRDSLPKIVAVEIESCASGALGRGQGVFAQERFDLRVASCTTTTAVTSSSGQPGAAVVFEVLNLVATGSSPGPIDPSVALPVNVIIIGKEFKNVSDTVY